jgi:hypothetical protein
VKQLYVSRNNGGLNDHLYETNGEANKEIAVGFKYQVYRTNGTLFEELYSTHVNVVDQKVISEIFSVSGSGMDGVYRILLETLGFTKSTLEQEKING